MNKLLCLLLLSCIYVGVNAQAPIFATSNGCGPVPPISGRFDFVSVVNGKNEYVYSEDNRLKVGFDGSIWHLFANNDYSLNAFTNTGGGSSLLPPQNGWVSSNCPAGSTFSISYSSQETAVTGISVRGVNNLTSVSTNSTLQMEAIVAPSNADNKSVTWTVQNNTGSATISGNGVLSGVSEGTVTVRATAQDGSDVFGEQIITITSSVVDVTTLSIQSSSTQVDLNGSLQMTVNVFPANATNKDVTWSVENLSGSATISTSGQLTGTSLGFVRVRATAQDGSGVSSTRNIEVIEPFFPVSVIAIQGRDAINAVEVGDILQMEALVLPTNATDPTLTWSVINGTGRATISQSAILTGVRAGQVTVRASATDGSGIIGETIINVVAQSVIPVNNISIESTTNSFDLQEDGQLQLRAIVSPTNATNRSVVWSVSNESGLATINQNGLLSGVQAGAVLVSVEAADGSGVIATQLVTIAEKEDVLVSSIQILSPNNVSELLELSNLQLSTVILPNNADDKSVTWTVSSLGGSAIIDPNGLLIAQSEGEVLVRAESNDIGDAASTRVFTITKPTVLATNISILSPAGQQVIEVDETLSLAVDISPISTTNQNVAWRAINGTGEVSVDQNGTVTGMSTGTATVIVETLDGSNLSDSLEITVNPIFRAVEGITIVSDNNQQSIREGSSLQFGVRFQPSNATNQDITWQVDDNTIATIDQNGLLNSLSTGDVNIIAIAQDGSNQSDTFTLSIISNDILVSSINITAPQTTVKEGEQLFLSTDIFPVDATNKSVEWSVVNQSGEATISQDGLLAAIGAGEVVVELRTLDGSELVDRITITISPRILVTSIAVSNNLNLDNVEVGDTLQFDAAILPQTADSLRVFWSTSAEEIATISSDGVLTALDTGSVLVIATATDASGVRDTFVLTVNPKTILVSTLVLNPTDSISLKIGDSFQFTPTIGPENATNSMVEYEVIEGTGTGTILGNGLFVGSEIGDLEIVVKSTDGSNLFDTTYVNVIDSIVLVSEIVLDFPDSLFIGQSAALNATVLPINASNKAISWSIVSGEENATIALNEVRADKAGAFTIQAIAADDSRILAQKSITVVRDPNGATFSSVTLTTCGEFESPSGLNTWTESGQYVDTITNTLGNDSIIQFDLTFVEIDDAIIISDSGLVASSSVGTFQWLNCSNNQPIPGAVSRSYLPMDDGSYGLQITFGTCVENSTCVSYNTVSNQSTFDIEPSIFPNPSYGEFTINLHANYQNVEVVLFDMLGKTVATSLYDSANEVNITENLEPGLYIVRVRTETAYGSFKISVLR